MGSESEIHNPQSEILTPPSALRPPLSDRGSKGERTANLALAQREREPTTSLAPRPSPHKSEIRNPKSEISDPQSLIPNPLFSVRTPTAIVTDLGTEFGVEVEKSGATRSHVFQGKVELRNRSASGSEVVASKGNDRVILLRASEAARVERGPDDTTVITREPGQPDRFIRRMLIAASQSGSSSNGLPQQPWCAGRRIVYRLTDLGTLGGATSNANAINAAGQVVGESDTATGAKHAFLYADGKMKDLGTLDAGNSCAEGINARGQVVGWSGPSEADCRAFLYSGGVMKRLGTLGGPTATAFAISDAGQIAGYSLDSNGVARAFLYTPGDGMKDLGALGGPKAKSWAKRINAAGLVVGQSETDDRSLHAFVYSRAAGMKDLGTLGGRVSHAFGINDMGLVVGFSAIGNGITHAFLFGETMGMKDLGTLGGPNSSGGDINNAGQVVGAIAEGMAGGKPLLRALLYSGGKMLDLNAMVDPFAGWTLRIASAINDSGQIAGCGTTPDGRRRAFLLTPVIKTGESPITKTGKEK